MIIQYTSTLKLTPFGWVVERQQQHEDELLQTEEFPIHPDEYIDPTWKNSRVDIELVFQTKLSGTVIYARLTSDCRRRLISASLNTKTSVPSTATGTVTATAATATPSMYDMIKSEYPGYVFDTASGFEDAIIGVDEESMKLIYSINKCIEIIMVEENISREGAIEDMANRLINPDNTVIFCCDIYPYFHKKS